MTSIVGRFVPNSTDPQEYLDLPIAVDVNGVIQMHLVTVGGAIMSLPPTQIAVLTPPTNLGYARDVTINTLLKPSSALASVTSITNTVVVKADTLVNQTSSLKVDGSSVVQPVSGNVNVSNFPSTQTVNGTITANAGTDLNTSLLARETGGNLADVKVNIGSQTDLTATTSSGNFSLIALFKRLLSVQLPLSLGSKSAANAFPVTLSPDGIAGDISFKMGEAQFSPSPNTILDRLRIITNILSNPQATKSNAFTSTATIQRANNTIRYLTNDQYGATFELTGFGNPNGWVYLADIRIIFNFTSLPIGMGSMNLYLYSGMPPSTRSDNDAFSLPAIDRSSCLTPNGILLNAQLAVGGGSVIAVSNNINRKYKLSANGSVFAQLVTLSEFSPAFTNETASFSCETMEV